MASVRLFGNYRKAARWVPVGYQKLYQMKEQMQRLGLQQSSAIHKFHTDTPEDDVTIEVSSITYLNFKDDPIQLRMAKYNDASVDVINITCGKPVGLYAFIVAHVGSTTIDYVRRYYDLKGQEIADMPVPMFDDGRYRVSFVGVPSEDPWAWSYGPVTDKDGNTYQPAGINETLSSNHKNIEFGLGVPECPGGQDSKSPSLINHTRFMLNQAAENEAFRAITVTCYNSDSYSICVPVCSLGQFPYALNNQQTPFMNRYTPLGILSTHPYLIDLGGGVAGMDAVSCETFADYIYSVSRLYHTGFGRTNDHEYIELFNADIALAQDLLQVQQRKGRTLTHRLYQAIGWQDVAGIILEPYNDYTWGLSFFSNSFVMLPDSTKTLNRSDHRCLDSSNLCYYLRNGWITGYFATPAREHGDPNTISNNVKKPFDIDKDGRLSYVKIEKATETFSAGVPTDYGWNVNLYVKDQPITQNVMAIRPVQYTDHLNMVGGWPSSVSWCWADVRLMPVTYEVLHSNIGNAYQCVIYEKHELIDDGLTPLDYKAYVSFWAEPFYRVAERWHRERVTYWIYVNGKHYQIMKNVSGTDVPVENVQTHRQFLITPTPDATAHPNIVNAHAVAFGNHALDVAAGEQVARIFTSVTSDLLLVGFDIYPIEMSHDIVRENYVGFDGGGLLFNYTGSPYTFPPLIDSTFAAPNDRQWLMFNLGGNYQNIPAPATNRVNGMGLMLVESAAPPPGATLIR